MNKRTLMILLAAVGIPLGCYVIVMGIRDARLKAVRPDNVKMETAISSARASVDTFIAQLNKPQQNRRYLVKFRVEQGDLIEHIWAEPVAYHDGRFRGILINEPYQITSVAKGDTYSAPKDAISDWMIMDPDGKRQGGWTEDAL